ncbi:hypothetical protein ACPEEZ_14890 [Frigoribacterium sp. 2-23]|uniref:hypothetical protein n=1 Tax=Frigoribacterium sp. 2-23 TaxID=3415006 RepID=UPI003C705928
MTLGVGASVPVRARRSAVGWYLLGGLISGGLVGMLLYGLVELGPILPSLYEQRHDTNMSFFLIVIVIDMGSRGAIVGTVIGFVAALPALAARSVVKGVGVRRAAGVAVVAVVAGLAAGALAWLLAEWAGELLAHAGGLAHGTAAALVGAAVAAVVELIVSRSEV